MVVGGSITFFLTGSLFGLPAENGLLGVGGIVIPDPAAGDVVGTTITWVGLGIVFFALVWACYPEMEVTRASSDLALAREAPDCQKLNRFASGRSNPPKRPTADSCRRPDSRVL